MQNRTAPFIQQVALKYKTLNAVFLALLLSACELNGSSDFAPPVETLAKTVPIAVGTRQFYLPVVAISWAGGSNVSLPCPGENSPWLCAVPLETLVANSGIKGKPVSATMIEVTLDNYKNYYNKRREIYYYIPQLCGMLIQQWARRQCSGPSLFRDSLRRFTIIHVDALATSHTISIGNQSAFQVVQKMQFVNDEPNIDCFPDGDGQCIAAMRISNEVLVLWIVSGADTHSIRRQAAAIRAFLNYAAGREENYEELKASLSRAT